MNKTDLAYAAGIIDGEGCISISVRHQAKSHYPIYNLLVTVSSTDEFLPVWLKSLFAGHLFKQEPPYPRRTVWTWAVETRQAATFLRPILPYLKLKKPQAELALKFQARKRNWGMKGKPLAESILEEADYISLKEMHRTRRSKET